MIGCSGKLLFGRIAAEFYSAVFYSAEFFERDLVIELVSERAQPFSDVDRSRSVDGRFRIFNACSPGRYVSSYRSWIIYSIQYILYVSSEVAARPLGSCPSAAVQYVRMGMCTCNR